MMKQKRAMSTVIWILIILILVAVAMGIFFWLSGSDGGILGGGSLVPQPPALPTG